jgi:hypothetical protein
MNPYERCDLLYFIQMGKSGPIKIGASLDVEGRRKTLQTSSPYPLTVLLALPMVCRSLEAKARSIFSVERLSGEWVFPSVRVRLFINKMQKRKEEFSRYTTVDQALQMLKDVSEECAVLSSNEVEDTEITIDRLTTESAFEALRRFREDETHSMREKEEEIEQLMRKISQQRKKINKLKFTLKRLTRDKKRIENIQIEKTNNFDVMNNRPSNLEALNVVISTVRAKKEM